MKRLFLGVAIASALGLTGCGGEELNHKVEPLTPVSHIVDPANKVESLMSESHIAFDPGNKDPAKRTLPIPNDLLFSGTLDGTINMPNEKADGSSDYTEPEMAIGALDGWSTVAPISITVELATDLDGKILTLDAASVSQLGAVRMFEATVGGPLSSDPDCQTAASASACKVGDELQFGVDFVAKAVGNTIAIVPVKPLKANQSYIYATTDLILDSAGQSVAASSTYNSVRLDIETLPLETVEQLSLQTLVNSFEKGLAKAHSVDSSTLSYSGLFTTQSIIDVYKTVQLLMLDPSAQDSFAPCISVPVDASMTVGTFADVYTATLTAPTYSGCNVDICSGIDTYWKALGDSPVEVLLALQTGTMSQQNYAKQATVYDIDPNAALANPALLVGKTWLLDDGEAADKAKHLTKFNSIPNPTGYENIPVLITIPKTPVPTTGWPTVIVMHGLGGGKEMSLAYAGMYASKGVATIAIDMPLHGARSHDAVNDGVYEVSATDESYAEVVGTPGVFDNGSPLVFINIESTLTARDNFRQAILDHLALRVSLTGLAGALQQAAQAQIFDMDNISVQGLSLGAIVSTNFSAYANTELQDPNSGTDLSYAYKINAASLVAPAGGFAGTFIGSATFGPLFFSEVTASNDFLELVADANTENYVSGTDNYNTLVEAVYAGFLPGFSFAVQTAMDSADPINHTAMLKATGLPVHVIEVVGDGDMHLPDQVLPNTVEDFPISATKRLLGKFPLSGTEPLITNLDLACVSTTTAETSGAVRFIKGHHSSLVDPNGIEKGAAAATI